MPTGLKISGKLCGSWTYDSVYMGVPQGKRGIPFSSYVQCPAIPIDINQLNIAAQGVNILPALDANGQLVMDPNGNVPVYDVYDVVGTSFYKYPLDFYMECKRAGFARKVSPNLPWHFLSPTLSNYYCISKHAVIDPSQVRDLRDEIVLSGCKEHKCLHDLPEHKLPWKVKMTRTCCLTWWHALAEKDCKHGTKGWFREGAKPDADTPGEQIPVHPTKLALDFDYGIFLAIPFKSINLYATTPAGSSTLSPEMEDAAQKMRNAGFNPRTEVL